MTAEVLVQECLDVIVERDPVVRAWECVGAREALAAARAHDAGGVAGPLAGVPFGVKDVFDSADLPTAYGSPMYRGYRPSRDAAIVAAARAAGGVLLGKTVTTEFGLGSPAVTTNPHDSARTPGGSSSGSAAAVACGMVPWALGAQTGGSVIRPASFCGVVGFKPTFGALSRSGLFVLSESIDTVGVFARTVADVALVASTLAGWTAPLRVRPSRPPVFLLWRTPEWPWVDDSTTAVFAEVSDAIRRGRGSVEERVLPFDFGAVSSAAGLVTAFEASRAFAHERHHRTTELSDAVQDVVARGASCSPEQVLEAQGTLRGARGAVDRAIEGIDAVLTPSAAGEAPGPPSAGIGDPRFNRAWTALHGPCLSLPAGTGPAGLPLGVQLVGGRAGDIRLLKVAAWLEEKLGPPAIPDAR